MLLGIVIVFLVVFLVAWWGLTNVKRTYMVGYWLAESDAFCEESKAEYISLYVGPESGNGAGGVYVCYLIIPEVVSSEFVMKCCCSVGMGFGLGDVELECEDVDFPWPGRVKVDVDVMGGRMKIYDGKQTYAKLYKRHDISAEMVTRGDSGDGE